MSALTTHVLDTSRGRPAAGVEVTLEIQEDGDWRRLGRARTDADGRIQDLLAKGLITAIYRLRFGVGEYFAEQGIESFHPEVQIVFRVWDADEHHHVPLLVSPFGYTTYRGS